jgi:SAM-dependent methyltransferase
MVGEARRLIESSGIPVCPICHGPLRRNGERLVCAADDVVYEKHASGYYDFTPPGKYDDVETTTDEYADEQEAHWRRFYDAFLRPWLAREEAQRVLEVGCGVGMGVRFAREQGLEAYGIDLACLAPYWQRAGNDPEHFFFAEGARLPFPDGYFGALYCLGVIEHVGTVVGHYTLAENYREEREAFARELLRVTKPGGRLLVTCPNRRFPIDIHHEPSDDATPEGAMRFRRWFYDRFGMTLHPILGTHHLFSLGDFRQLFVQACGARTAEPLPLRHYFAFHRMGSLPGVRLVKSLAAAFIEQIPRPLRGTCFDPFLVVEIRR